MNNFVDYSIGIVAFASTERLAMAHELMASVNALVLNPDDGELGCAGNHAFIQNRLATEPGWTVVLEDDAVPLNAFQDDLEWVLQHAPHPIVSLYLGTGYPQNWQKRMVDAVAAGTSWIVSSRILHAVGYAIAPEIKGDLAWWMSRNKRGPGMEPDEAMSVWANAHQIKVAYTNPSLVDHRDTATAIRVRRNHGVFAHGRNRPRHAHNTRQRLTWDDSAVIMDHHGNS